MTFLLALLSGCGTPGNDNPGGGTTSETYTYVGGWGSEGDADGQFKYPCRLTLNGNDVYVIDWGNCETPNSDLVQYIQKFSAVDGSFQSRFGSFGSGDGQFINPYDLKVNAGMIYVVDAGNNRILKFSGTTFLGWLGSGSDGTTDGITGWHSPGTAKPSSDGGMNGDGQFSMPEGIAFDSTGNMYVADTGNHRIQKYGSDGKFLGWWGNSASGPGWHPKGSGLTGVEGSGDGEFKQPSGIAVGPGDYIYVLDFFNSRIQKFKSDGTYVKQWGGGRPLAICVDSAGNVYVLDALAYPNFIKKFSSDGVLLATFGKNGTQTGQLKGPTDIDVDAAGQVYVVDTTDHRIKIFAPSAKP